MGDPLDRTGFQNFLDNIESLGPPHDATSPESRINGVCIPQRKYNMGLSPDFPNMIAFMRQDGTFVPVKAASEGDHTGLIDYIYDIPPYCPEVGCHGVIAVQFEWPGYAPYRFELPTDDWYTPPGRIILSKLATEVSKIIRQFLETIETQDVAPEHQQWRVGPNGIRLEHLHLAALEQVTAGGYQLRLFLKP